jgi:molybdenum cofactor guanylyltransferase
MLLGIFVGGRARRMQGAAKGLLRAPESGEPIVVRLVRVAEDVGLTPLLVGRDARYDPLLPNLRYVADRANESGPLSGLASLLDAAAGEHAIAVACDLPYLSSALLARLANEQPHAPVLAARATSLLWEPLCARYDPNVVLPALNDALAHGVSSFQQLLRTLNVAELALNDHERLQLKDWDSPEDID